MDERTQKMIELRNDGHTQQHIGDNVGLSQQRVSAILANCKNELVEKRITRRQEEAYRLVFIQDMSIRQAAIIMGISPITVHRHINTVFNRYPSLRAGFQKPKTVLVGDWNVFDQTKIVQKF
jgi:DNA-directed RNA polymerase specialized sigma subunit